MKNSHTGAFIAAIICFVSAAVVLSQTEPLLSIQWQWENGRLFERYTNSRTLQFGLRSDGIVVWREVVATTNSPAENTGIPHRSRARPEIVPPPPPTNQPGPGPLPR